MSATWDGRGLPPIAEQRLQRARSSSLTTSLLSVPSTVSNHAVGLVPVGEVMGCTVHHIGWQGWGGCGVYGYRGSGYRGGGSIPLASHEPYVRAVRGSYDTALARLGEEANALGAHGAIDVRITVHPMDNDTFEFVAMGTAVRFLTPEHAPAGRLFITDLPGADVAKLLLSGWLPTAVLYGIALTVRHDDWATIAQSRFTAGNTEVSGFTQLTTHTRHQARLSLQSQAQRHGVDGVLVTTQNMRVWEQEVAEGHRDHLAEARMFGTGVVQFRAGRAVPPPPLTILPLNRMSQGAK